MKIKHDEPELDPPIRTMIDATNRGDSAAFLTAFADDAVLVDWGRTFTGKSEIAKWNAEENIGTQNHLRVTHVHRTAAQVRVTVAVTGKGYNGDGIFLFDLGPTGITRMVIS
ncbi:MAG: nuclear transport factor 2 family protein [Gemmatimonadota bacterium]|nr:nuclear transport factor 2 family protein [Gemmatimonadota bacterium]